MWLVNIWRVSGAVIRMKKKSSKIVKSMSKSLSYNLLFIPFHFITRGRVELQSLHLWTRYQPNRHLQLWYVPTNSPQGSKILLMPMELGTMGKLIQVCPLDNWECFDCINCLLISSWLIRCAFAWQLAEFWALAWGKMMTNTLPLFNGHF